MKRNILITAFIFTLMFVGNAFASSGVSVEFKPNQTAVNNGNEFEVDVIMKNPSNQNVISVRSWLEYDTNLLEGVSVDTQGTIFTLSAPGEDEFSVSEGRVKIGRSNITGGVSDSEVKIATIKFRVKTDSAVTTVLSPYDYQVTELGHNSVNIIDQGFPVNILTTEPESINISLNSGGPIGGNPATDYYDGTTNGNNIDNTVNNNPVVVSMDGFVLTRPTGLKINTGSNYVDLKWDTPFESDRLGYNLYYGKVSGKYTRRRDIGNISSYRLDDLNNDEVYYFAITAYDKLNRETDYSDEVAIIVNQPLSSTSPFDGLLDLMLAKLPNQPQNGPLTTWTLFFAITFAGMMFFRKKIKV